MKYERHMPATPNTDINFKERLVSSVYFVIYVDMILNISLFGIRLNIDDLIGESYQQVAIFGGLPAHPKETIHSTICS